MTSIDLLIDRMPAAQSRLAHGWRDDQLLTLQQLKDTSIVYAARQEIVRRVDVAKAPMTPIATGWAVHQPYWETTVVLCHHDATSPTERDAWKMAVHFSRDFDALIEEAKSRGARAFRCEVRETGEETT